MSGDKSCHAVRWAALWLMQHIKFTQPCPSKHLSGPVSPLSPLLPTWEDSISPTCQTPAPSSCLARSFLTTHIFSLCHIPAYSRLSQIKALVLSPPPAYLTARQIAPLVSKWPQQKDNDKRAVISSVCPRISRHCNWLQCTWKCDCSSGQHTVLSGVVGQLVIQWPPRVWLLTVFWKRLEAVWACVNFSETVVKLDLKRKSDGICGEVL